MIKPPLEVEVSLDRDDYFFRALKDKDAKKAINGTELGTSYFNLGETYEVWKLLKSGEAIYFWGGCKEISATSYMEREDWEEVVLFEVLGEPQRGDESRSDLETKTIRWLQDFNEELFVDMFRYEYEVEAEQKYIVELPSAVEHDDMWPIAVLSKASEGKLKVTKTSRQTNLALHDKYLLTEKEIKDYEPNYWPFAKRIEELEE